MPCVYRAGGVTEVTISCQDPSRLLVVDGVRSSAACEYPALSRSPIRRNDADMVLNNGGILMICMVRLLWARAFFDNKQIKHTSSIDNSA